jgi:hypothetical protein
MRCVALDGSARIAAADLDEIGERLIGQSRGASKFVQRHAAKLATLATKSIDLYPTWRVTALPAIA